MISKETSLDLNVAVVPVVPEKHSGKHNTAFSKKKYAKKIAPGYSERKFP